MQIFPDPNTAKGSAQLGVASLILKTLQDSYALSYNGAIGGVANAFAESSLMRTIAGDKGAAGGLWQLHGGRRAAVLAGCGVDMWEDGVAEQCRGIMWEMTQPKNKYLGWREINSAATPEDAAEAWCRYDERPANMERDVAMRRQYASEFAAYFPIPPRSGMNMRQLSRWLEWKKTSSLPLNKA